MSDTATIPAVFVMQEPASATVIQADILTHTATRDAATGLTFADVRLHGLLGTERHVPLLLTDDDAPGFHGGKQRHHPCFAMARNHKLAQQLLQTLRQQAQLQPPPVLGAACYELIHNYNELRMARLTSGSTDAPAGVNRQASPAPRATGCLRLAWTLTHDGDLAVETNLLGYNELLAAAEGNAWLAKNLAYALDRGAADLIEQAHQLRADVTAWLDRQGY